MIVVTCVGLFLCTRILIPDVIVTLCVCACFWAFQRALNEDHEEPHPGRWAALLAAVMGVGVLLKALIARGFPVGGALVYLVATRQPFLRDTWRGWRLIRGTAILLATAAPADRLPIRRWPHSLFF